jgi:hypothetical protein
MQVLKVIIPFDARCCSLNCVSNSTYTGKCTVKGEAPGKAETIGRDGDLYLRTDYCVKNASSDGKVTHLPVDE